MTISTQYAISQNGSVHGFLVSDVIESKQDAVLKLAEYKEQDADNEYNEKIHVIEIESSQATGVGADESDSTVTVEIEALIDGVREQVEYYVQTDGGRYRTETGCWILTPDGEGDSDFSEIESLIFACVNITELAEDYLGKA